MPSVKPKIKVIKVPRQEKLPDYPQSFPRMPILYLELLENPEKVKPELLNKPYKPALLTPDKPRDAVTETYKPSADSGSIKDTESPAREPKPHREDDLEDRLDKLLNNSRSEPAPKESPDVAVMASGDNDESHRLVEPPVSPAPEEDELASRLTKLLSDDSKPTEPLPQSPDKYSRARYEPELMRSANTYIPPPPPSGPGSAQREAERLNQEKRRALPPTLDEIQAQGGYRKRQDMRDVAKNHNVASEQEEEDLKREYLYKIRILRKAYQDGNFEHVENFTVHTDLELMKREYEDTVRGLSLDSTVENYRTWLMYGFVGCELLFGKFLKLDMEGFATQQMVNMKKYDRLLLELGEKNYSKGPSRIPVELRLLGMVLLQAAFFLVTKMVTKKGGANLFGMVNGFVGGASTPAAPRRRMKPPSVSVDELPDA